VIEEEPNTFERLLPPPSSRAGRGCVPRSARWHRATLPNGRRVAVQVPRPGATAEDARRPRPALPKKCKLGSLGAGAIARPRLRETSDTRQLVDEFRRSIRKGSTTAEGRNAHNFPTRHFAGHPHVQRAEGLLQYKRARGVLTLRVNRRIPACRTSRPHQTSLEDRRRKIAYRSPRPWMTNDLPARVFSSTANPHPSEPSILPPAGRGGDDRPRRLRGFRDAHPTTTGRSLTGPPPLHRASHENHRQLFRSAWPPLCVPLSEGAEGVPRELARSLLPLWGGGATAASLSDVRP